MSKRKEITTKRGTVFPVISETPHYLMCREPTPRDTVQDALVDLDDMADIGLFVCLHIPAHRGGLVVFEKRGREDGK